jgi:Family of unknown function (DUF5990)
VRITIIGRDLPGRRFVSDGVPLTNVHVGVQVGREPADLVPADAPSAHWHLDVRAVADETGVDLRGPGVHGRRGERFLYMTWGDIGAGGSFAMFRRAKLMVGDVDSDLLAAAATTDGTIVAELGLTDAHGCPLSGRVRPPDVRWRAA